jgi:hypothetical protein
MARYLVMLMVFSGTLLAQDSPHGELRIPCASCHVTDAWNVNAGKNFNHASTGFALTGQHNTIPCVSCHQDLRFTRQDKNCRSCHTDIHRGDLGPDCQRCHSPESWKVKDMRQRHQRTRFPLLGRHATVDCASCHVSSNEYEYSGVSTDCIGCHRTEYQGAKNPNHISGGFSAACEKCHKVTALVWSSGFDHATTAFPLTGAHRATACTSCHQNGVYTGLPTDCYSCHTSDFAGTTNPGHTAGNFSHDCNQCHTTAAWNPASFNHSLTRFPLTGAHKATLCSSCHKNNIYTGLSPDCYSCHTADFAATTNPNHLTGNFGHDCTPCHSTAAWKPASFDHATTALPLTGAHQSVACNTCHVNNVFSGLNTDCYSCHTSDFTGTTNPNHVSSNYSHDCTTCHSTTAWKPSSFNHALTAFPLTGAHQTVACNTCHVNNVYAGTARDCYTCHTSDFAGTTNPNHLTGNYSHDCTTCHTTAAWTPASFNHSLTAFPLTGAHQAVACNSCHVNNVYAGLTTDCYSCHTSDFTGSTNPSHTAGNFSHDCTQCHTTGAWSPASFNHATTAFPLTGAHTSTACQDCHTNGNYQLTYTSCYPCHQTDFQNATNPNHVSSGFSQDCTPCHTTSVWKPSTFDHDGQYFRIYSGHHRGRWTTCNQCHPSSGTFVDFTCLSCHEHNQTDMDAKHRGRNGYSYSSPACYNCHRGS